MIPLPLANILHHKIRSALTALGVAIGVAMLVTLVGLSRGTLGEVADRWEGVDADLIITLARKGSSLASAREGQIGRKDIDRIRKVTAGGNAAFETVIPVYVHRWRIADQEHNVVAAAPEHLPYLMPGRKLESGRAPDAGGAFADWLAGKLSASAASGEVLDIPPAELASHGGLEMVVDARLARAGGYRIGSKIHTGGNTFTVVGVAPDGAMARAFIPLATGQWLGGDVDRATFLFARLGEGVDQAAGIGAVEGLRRFSAVPLRQFRAMLMDEWHLMFVSVDVANTITLLVAFLFVLVTLYTAVIQRTREIAILRSMGATRGYVLRQVTGESLILTAAGAAAGIGLSLVGGWVIEAVEPFLTVTITPAWLATAAGVALLGGVAASLYPAWCAIRVDVTEAINLE